MTIKQYNNQIVQMLAVAGITSARLDATILLEDEIERDRSWILAHDDHELSDAQIAKLEKLLTQRAKHVPLAYLRGQVEFYGRNFKITPNVLVPRPESETMITLLKQLFIDHNLPVQDHATTYIADVGTGSGALGITASLELPGCQIELLDISSEALDTAEMNVDLHTTKVSLQESDLLAASSQRNDVLLCNLPYVPDDYPINAAARHEPALALFAGDDGLDLYRQLFKQIDDLDYQPLYILTEALPEQHAALSELAKKSGYAERQMDGFIQVFGR